MIEFAMRSSWGMIDHGWLLLAPVAFVLLVYLFAFALARAASKPTPKPTRSDPIDWRGGWRT
jgi:hypothetical protein